MRKLFCAALLLIPLAGCGSSNEAEAAPETKVEVQNGTPWFDEIPAATGGGKLEPCALPVTFDVAEEWKSKTVTLDGGPLDALARQGDSTVVCEIDAKPAGNIGFLRVWTSTSATEKAALESFLGAEAGSSDIRYRDLADGVEASWRVTTELTPEGKYERAMAVRAADKTVVLTLSGLDQEEFDEMLPAYVLAKSTLKKS